MTSDLKVKIYIIIDELSTMRPCTVLKLVSMQKVLNKRYTSIVGFYQHITSGNFQSVQSSRYSGYDVVTKLQKGDVRLGHSN